MKITPKLFLLLSAFPSFSFSAFSQGDLTPPGKPAATMKTLDQIDTHIDVKGEKRIDLQNAPASAVTTTDANYHFIITQPGSYYLSANLGVTKTNGILINAEGVTLDLNGFQLSRTGGTGGSGIEIGAISHRASVRNGSIKGFANGLNSIASAGGYARGCGFRDLSASNCTAAGILAGQGAVLESCRAHNNAGSYGIFAGSGSSLTNCSASSNTTQFAIYTDDGCSLTNCITDSNTGIDGISSSNSSSLVNCSALHNTGRFGISVGTGSSLTNCSAYGNTGNSAVSAGISTNYGCTIRGCTAYGNSSTAPATSTTGMGFYLSGDVNNIRGCSASSNLGDGINMTNGTVAADNSCSQNGGSILTGGNGAGIHSTGKDNRIEGNNVTSNLRGINVSAAGNLIIRNSARNNGTSSAGNYVIVADNRYGPIIDDTAAGSIAASGKGPFSSTLNSTDPWANFSY